MARSTFASYLAQYRILLILAELDEGPKSSAELAAALHMDKSGVPAYLKHMGARVAAWRRPGTGNLVPLYDMRPGKGVRRPKAQTPTQRKREQWRRIKEDPARHARVKALQRIRQRRVRDGISCPVTIVIDGNVNRG